eukprot:246473_1
MNVYDQEHRDTNNLIWKWHKIPTPTNNNKGRKPDVIWDEFNRFTKVAKYEDTGNPVDMNSSIKADCKHCDSTDICGVWQTMCNHLASCHSLTENQRTHWKQQKEVRKEGNRAKRRRLNSSDPFRAQLPDWNRLLDVSLGFIHLNVVD